MPFKNGQSGNPKGRPVGSENKLNSQIKRKIQSILNQLDDRKLREIVKDSRSSELLSFLAKLMPKDINIVTDSEIKIVMSKDEKDLAEGK